jgi:hypothetical protein
MNSSLILVLDTDSLPPQVVGLTEASRRRTLRMMTPKEALERRMQWMRESFGGGNAEVPQAA